MGRLPVMLLVCVACGNISRPGVLDDARVTEDAAVPEDAGVTEDARVMDDAGVPPDAAIPDATVLPPSPAREFVSGAAQVTGPTYKFDVEIGHPIMQLKMSGATYQLEGNAAVKP